MDVRSTLVADREAMSLMIAAVYLRDERDAARIGDEVVLGAILFALRSGIPGRRSRVRWNEDR